MNYRSCELNSTLVERVASHLHLQQSQLRLLPHLVHHYHIWLEATLNQTIEMSCRAVSHTIQHQDPINTNFPHSFVCLTCAIFGFESVSLDDTPLVTNILFSGMTFTLPWPWTSMGWFPECRWDHQCTMHYPIFRPFCEASRGFFTYFYVVAMEFFQPVHGTCKLQHFDASLSHAAPTA